MEHSAETINNLVNLYLCKNSYPNSKGLLSLEALYLGSTSISNEGLLDNIKNRYQRFVDITLVKLNKLAGVFRKLTHEEQLALERIRNGEVTSKEVTLPISSAAVGNVVKFILAILTWFSLKTITSYLTGKFKKQRLADDENYSVRKRILDELHDYESMLKRKGDRVENSEANKDRIMTWATLSRCVHAFTDTLKGINWDEIERKAVDARDRDAACTAMSTKEYRGRRLFRTAVLGSVLALWIGLTVWIVKKIVKLIKFITNKLKWSTHEASGVDESDYDEDEY